MNAQDFHSYANPSAVRVRQVALDLNVLFDQKVLKGTAVLEIDRIDPGAPLVLDTRDLKIDKVETSIDGMRYAAGTFTLGASDKILGAPLTIQLPASANRARLLTSPGACNGYSTSPSRRQKDPFVYTQSEAIPRALDPARDAGVP